MTETDKIIREEIDKLLIDIIAAYEKSGRKVTGKFADGLEAVYEPNKATIKGFVYLAGRGATKKSGKSGEPTVLERIKQWIQDKGIAQQYLNEVKPKTDKAKQNALNGLAYIITKKIHEEGTRQSEWLDIYNEVITQQRIFSIIERISEVNVNRIVSEIRAEFEILQTTY